MNDANKRLQQSALVMRILGWAMIALPLALPLYPPGFLWGSHSPDFPALVPHPESPLHGLHPYLFMIIALYLAWGILMVRGAKDPKGNAALFDYGILANVLHALLMVPQSFIYPNEHAHLWADIPALLAVAVVLWIYHPSRIAPDLSRT
jgi:hypothetical protein